MFFTNKHVVIALIVAPILAILAWFAVGQFAGEKAQPAAAGKSYPLVEKSNCRYDSGHCDLENEDFRLALELEGLDLRLRSDHILQGVMIAVNHAGEDSTPQKMTAVGSDGLVWRHVLLEVPPDDARIRLVASTSHNAYFGDAATVFIHRE